jgi:ferredoxin
MRVRVDEALCEGNALCMKAAPGVFVVGDDDRARLLCDPIDEGQRARVLEAIRRCPRQALTLVGE